MYKKDPNLRAAGEQYPFTPELIEEWVRCKTDIIYFAQKYFTIVHVKHGKIKIPLREYQKKMLKAFVEPDKEKRHSICLMPRQSGKSTVATIYLLWFALFNEDKEIAILANKEKTARKILRRIKIAYSLLPLWLQVGIRDGGWNQNSVILDNGMMMTASSTASTANRGDSLGLLFIDEFAFVPSHIADEFMSSVYPTIASSDEAKIIMVSTPNGMNHFHHFWQKAVRGKGSFRPIRVRWNEVPEYDEKFKAEEIENFGLKHWHTEYECRFSGSSTTLVDFTFLEGIVTEDAIDIKFDGFLNIYEKPEEDAFYVLGVDSAKGVGSDYSAVQVLKITAEHEVKQVAIYRNNRIPYMKFAQVVIGISDYYNEAYIMVENNDTGGGAQVADAMWYDFGCDRIINLDPNNIGVKSTRRSKANANLMLKRYIENGWLEIVDVNTLMELEKYEEVSPDIFKCAVNGSHDDCVTSMMWGLYFIASGMFDGKSIEVRGISEEYSLNEKDQPVALYNDGEDNFRHMNDDINYFPGNEFDGWDMLL